MLCNKYFVASSVQELFRSVHSTYIKVDYSTCMMHAYLLDFIKKTNFTTSYDVKFFIVAM